MATLNSTIHIEADPEVKAHIYQQLHEFAPFITPETVITVVMKDPMKLMSHFVDNGIDMTAAELRKMQRVTITLTEDGTTIEADGVSEDTFEAITIAKETLVEKLIHIQNSVITSQERAEQINSALLSGQLH